MTRDELAAAYAEAGSLARLAERLGCSKDTARMRMVRLGLPRADKRPRGKPRLKLAADILRCYRLAGMPLTTRAVADWSGYSLTQVQSAYWHHYLRHRRGDG